jgi:predicted CXXCH cytochrome family protein
LDQQTDRTVRSSTATRALPLLMVAAFVGLLLALARPALTPKALAQSAPARPAQQTIIGRECQQCHSQEVETFPANVHGKSAKFLTDERSAKCVACHRNSEKHVETATRTTMGEDPGNPAKLNSAQANQTCLDCHSGDRHLFEWRGGKHDREDMSCMSCHSVHHLRLPNWAEAGRERALTNQPAGLLDTESPDFMLSSLTVEETCFRCHGDKRKAFLQRSTHLFRTENRLAKVSCDACHDPHGGEGRRMMRDRTLNDTCFECHAEKRGPFLWEHTPVQENCMTCHAPHGSNHERLLTKRSHQLCQQCHINIIARHQTVAGYDVFTFNRGCVNCHSQVHGSNHPSGRAFTR